MVGSAVVEELEARNEPVMVVDNRHGHDTMRINCRNPEQLLKLLHIHHPSHFVWASGQPVFYLFHALNRYPEYCPEHLLIVTDYNYSGPHNVTNESIAGKFPKTVTMVELGNVVESLENVLADESCCGPVREVSVISKQDAAINIVDTLLSEKLTYPGYYFYDRVVKTKQPLKYWHHKEGAFHNKTTIKKGL